LTLFRPGDVPRLERRTDTVRVTARLALAAAAWTSAGCSTVPVRAGADFEPGYDFTRYTSYRWDEPDGRPTGDPRLDGNPFFIHRLHAAIHWELATRGIEYGAEGPALTVHHHASVRDRVEVLEADRAAGYRSAYGEGTQVIQYEEGTFLVDIADARTHEVIWRGWAVLDLTKALHDPEVMRKQIDEAIAKMFVSFPIPKGGTPLARAGRTG
jgi:hypothetical protein